MLQLFYGEKNKSITYTTYNRIRNRGWHAGACCDGGIRGAVPIQTCPITG